MSFILYSNARGNTPESTVSPDHSMWYCVASVVQVQSYILDRAAVLGLDRSTAEAQDMMQNMLLDEAPFAFLKMHTLLLSSYAHHHKQATQAGVKKAAQQSHNKLSGWEHKAVAEKGCTRALSGTGWSTSLLQEGILGSLTAGAKKYKMKQTAPV